MTRDNPDRLPDLIPDSQDPAQFCLRIKAELPSDIDPDVMADPRIESMRRYMFINQGWRLTHRGFGLLSKHYRSYSCQNEANSVVTGRILLSMDHCVGGPWFMRGARVHVFNQISQLELSIVGGDVRAFVDFRDPKG